MAWPRDWGRREPSVAVDVATGVAPRDGSFTGPGAGVWLSFLSCSFRAASLVVLVSRTGGKIGVVDFLGETRGGGMGVSAENFNGMVVVTVLEPLTALRGEADDAD